MTGRDQGQVQQGYAAGGYEEGNGVPETLDTTKRQYVANYPILRRAANGNFGFHRYE
jgi:hypothetical protein